MRISVDEALFQAFPGYVRHVVVAEGMDNSRGPEQLPDLERMLREAEAAVRADPAYRDPKADPRLAAWREAFQAFQVNPNKCPPSIFNLIKRVLGGASLPFINPLVCIFNVVSLHHGIPAGGDDLDQVVGDVRLGYADGTESYVPLGQPEARETPNPGEVILMDTGNRDVFCRAWCWKNGHPSRIQPDTRRVLINIDALPPVSAQTGQAAAEEVAALVERFCGGSIRIQPLAAGHSAWEI
jgi:DNA/RNA-binding domain of Phe-tRNA-synthetase-like protein